MDYINERIESLHLKRKVRSDAIYMNTFVLGSGHEFFEGMPTAKQEEFFEDLVKFFADKYGAENIISAVVHMDETTPHLHLNLVPITNGKLCSKDLYSPKKLSALQTELANTVGKKWGLKRGKIGSQAQHIEAAEYTANEIMTKAQAAADVRNAKPNSTSTTSYSRWRARRTSLYRQSASTRKRKSKLCAHRTLHCRRASTSGTKIRLIYSSSCNAPKGQAMVRTLRSRWWAI